MNGVCLKDIKIHAPVGRKLLFISKVKGIVKRILPCVGVGTQNQFNREVWLEATFKKIPAGSRILDAGAGEQQYKRFCGHLDYVSQDFAQYDGRGDSAGLQMGSWDQSNLDIISDITAIPEPDVSFDAIMCIEVFEHLPEPVKAIKEFGRLVKPGGHLILTAPFCSLTHFAPFHFNTGFNKYFYELSLKQNGFEIIEIETNGSYFEYIAQEIRRIPEVSQRYSQDKPNMFERIFLLFILGMLGRFARKDKGSSELLCFGYHILARKL